VRESALPEEYASSLLLRVLRLPEGGEYSVIVDVGGTEVETTGARLGNGFMLPLPQTERIEVVITLPFGD
jgi:hypothetical protein